MNSKLAKRRLSTETARVLTTGAFRDLDLDSYDLLEGWEPREGTILTRTRAISARINQNFDGWPSSELKKSYRTFLGKPVFVNHVNDDPRKARGRVVAARYVDSGDDKYIDVIQEVDAQKFPKLAHELVTGGLDSVSMGCEARLSKCSYCGNLAENMNDMCEHVLYHKGSLLTRQNEDGTVEDVLVYEECRDIGFFELSYVFDPADETAVVSRVVMSKKKRSFGEDTAPVHVDTLRDEDEDIEEFFIEPPEQLKDPDLDRSGEEPDQTEEGYEVGRLSQKKVSQNWTEIDDEFNASPEAIEVFQNWMESTGRDPNDEITPELEDEFNSSPEAQEAFESWMESKGIDDIYARRAPNRRKDSKMTPRKRTRNDRRRYYRSDVSRNDQGIQEEEAISTTPDSEPVDVGEDGANQNDRNEAEKPRKGLDNLEARRRARYRARRNMRRRRLADQSDDFDLDTSSDIQREVEDEDVEVSESAPETQPKDANRRRRSRRRARRRGANFQISVPEEDGGKPVPQEAWIDSDGDIHLRNSEGTSYENYQEDAVGGLRELGWDDEKILKAFEEYSNSNDQFNPNLTFDEWAVSKTARRRKASSVPGNWFEEDEDVWAFYVDEEYDPEMYLEMVYNVVEKDGDKFNWSIGEGGAFGGDAAAEGTASSLEEAQSAALEAFGPYSQKTLEENREYYGSRKRSTSRRRVGAQDPRLKSLYDELEIPEEHAPFYISENPFEPGSYDVWQRSNDPMGDILHSEDVPWDWAVDEISDFTPNIVYDHRDELSGLGEPQWEPAETPSGPRRARKKARRRTAGFLDKLTEEQRKMVMDNHNSWYEDEFDPNEDPAITEERAFDLAWETGILDDDGNFNQDAWDHGHDADPRARGASRRRWVQARRRKAVDLGVAEPGGRVDVERPVENTTDDEAQASQFNKKDFGDNAGDDVADPDLTTDQNWAPGEGKKESRFNKRASQIEGMRLAEAMIEAGVENPEDRWKLAERYTKLSSIIVRDRISLLEKVANVKSRASKEKVQRAISASRGSRNTAPRGLGQSTPLNKSSSNGQADDYSLYF